MKKKNLLIVLGLIFGSSVRGAVPVPVVNSWDGNFYLTTDGATVIQDLNKQLNELFKDYSGKEGAFSTFVIAEARKFLDEIDDSLQKVGGHELLSDRKFTENLKSFKELMKVVSDALAEGGQHKSSITHKRSEENKKKVVSALKELQAAKTDLVAYVKYLGGEESLDQSERTATLMREKTRTKVLKEFQDFVEEMRRKGQGQATMSLDELYGKGLLVLKNNNDPFNGELYLLDGQKERLDGYLKQLSAERSERDALNALLDGKEVLFSVPHQDGGHITMHYKPQQTSIVEFDGGVHRAGVHGW